MKEDELTTFSPTTERNFHNSNDDFWQEQLTPEQFEICRCGGTERAFTGEYWDLKTAGIYSCACCHAPLFSSTDKYDSGSGWPSYWQPINKEAVLERIDNSHGMTRTEALCAACHSHLGHVFTDGPQPTGLRFCINSASLSFKAT